MNSEASTSNPNEAQAASSVDRLLSEGLIGTSAAARLLGSFKNERPVHPSTLARWALRGVRTADGRVVRLEAARIGGKLVTSRSAIIRFITAQRVEQVVPPSSTTRSPGERQRASEAAQRRLEQSGA